MEKLIIRINHEIAFEFEKDYPINDQQLEFLDKMDADMRQGIKIAGKIITEPDQMQRSIFVSMNLIKALQQNNQAAISVSCTYLINRQPNLKEVHAADRDNKIHIDLISE